MSARQTSSRVNSQSGFTLAETLVALFILTLVSTTGAALLMGSTSASKQIRERNDISRTIDLAQALIRSDIGALSARAVLEESGFGRPGNLFGGETRSGRKILQFVRSGWLNPDVRDARSQLQLVRYRLEDQKLIRESFIRPDISRGTPKQERVLFEQVRDVEVRFQSGGVWSLSWNGDDGRPLHELPDLIEMTITFETEQTLTLAVLTGGRA